MRALKIAGFVLVGLILLAAAAIAALVIGGDKLVGELIQNRASAMLAHRVTIGHLAIRWARPLRITGDNIHVANAPWGSTPDMFAARHLELELDPSALLRLSLRVRRLVLDEPALFLETSAEGRRNWTPSGEPSAGAPLRRIAEIGAAALHHGRFHFRNGQSGAETDVAVDDLSAETPDAGGPIHIAAAGTFQRQPFALSATLAPLTRLHAGHEPYRVKLDGHLGTNSFVVDGNISDPPKRTLALKVDLKGQSIQDLLATLGVPVPKLPIYRLAGDLQHDGAEWRFTAVTGHIGDSLVSGDILVDESGTVPYIRADLNAEYLDLADLRGFYGGDPNKRPQAAPHDAADKGRVIPDLSLPVGKLLGFNADVTLDAPWVKPAAGLPFEHVQFSLSLKDGTLRIKPVRVAVAHGDVSGDLEYGSTASPPRFHADLDIRRVDLQRLLAGTTVSADLKQTAGVLGGFAKLDSAGTTQRQILAALRGDIGFFLQGGRLSSSLARMFEHDIAEALGLAPTNDEPHPINCLIARFAVDHGVATAATLLLDTKRTVVTGQGNVNLADETFFLDLTPYPKHAGSSRFGVPLEIRGTFAKPDITPEKVGLARRLGAAIGLLTPPAVLLPMVDTGLGDKNKCREAFAASPPPGEGSSAPRRR
ncbi:MAG TPA: AsmA family protein [Stellaceae bacterium]|nr:AsmA family protein [Stellaceae bacterium]